MYVVYLFELNWVWFRLFLGMNWNVFGDEGWLLLDFVFDFYEYLYIKFWVFLKEGFFVILFCVIVMSIYCLSFKIVLNSIIILLLGEDCCGVDFCNKLFFLGCLNWSN